MKCKLMCDLSHGEEHVGKLGRVWEEGTEEEEFQKRSVGVDINGTSPLNGTFLTVPRNSCLKRLIFTMLMRKKIDFCPRPLSVRSLDVLPVSVWAFSWHFGFLPHLKDVPI